MSITLISFEDSSSYPDEEDDFGLELGLGLSLAGAAGRAENRHGGGFTAGDYMPAGSVELSSSSSSSSTSSRDANKPISNGGSSGSKRAAGPECDNRHLLLLVLGSHLSQYPRICCNKPILGCYTEPSSPPCRSAVRQVIGWPPVRTYRFNSSVNHMKHVAIEEATYQSRNNMVHNSNFSSNEIDNNMAATKDTKLSKTSFFVKVNMDGIPIGRKVDLNAHTCYETLSLTLDQMFGVSAGADTSRINVDGNVVLPGPSHFSLTYEDKEGDWMLVGDVPWEVFVKSVKRLRIRRAAAKANGSPNPT